MSDAVLPPEVAQSLNRDIATMAGVRAAQQMLQTQRPPSRVRPVRLWGHRSQGTGMAKCGQCEV